MVAVLTVVACAVGALALLAAGCGSESSGENGQVKVVATTTQVADFVREVGGEAVERHPDPAAQQRPARLRATAL